jgi:hypothetical protein
MSKHSASFTCRLPLQEASSQYEFQTSLPLTFPLHHLPKLPISALGTFYGRFLRILPTSRFSNLSLAGAQVDRARYLHSLGELLYAVPPL